MYDFYFGENEQIFSDEKNYLLTVKRMMPRWCNSIPDSEFLAIYDDLNSSNIVKNDSKGVIVETGCGASTIVLSYFALKYNKKLYTWDTNQNKLSYIRSIICDTHQRVFQKALHSNWIYIGYLSTSKELGIPMLSEKNESIDFGFFDSEHTSDVLVPELQEALKLINDKAIFALDDANYRYKHKNIAYINVFRKKLQLPPVAESPDNLGECYYDLAESIIKEKFPKSVKIKDSYKETFKDDIFWNYFSNDRAIMNSLGMEKMKELEHRYDSFLINK
ncbi:class I SAM-dependent methyltransferase [Leptospira bandrabouensis]|uniref:class I SAM-dependent methyltransferase n=1 Tax=Leptospira bandrabouensis TaxID=2484903 RepID=UPI001EE8180E|nr:class I SAM-dependent methyltransferase [Leptospira bandrabouensis]MCG6144937.1 class I SAM-dependent methyltransferase [Leptospira bandrabouensis]MCG6160426.1 class I SAM-dependent methyltransferase [Leptospira bandrabouensis]MCG6164358.1 class I SAM-dependent methyltransferase [Leptospira bandrabouensis]